MRSRVFPGGILGIFEHFSPKETTEENGAFLGLFGVFGDFGGFLGLFWSFLGPFLSDFGHFEHVFFQKRGPGTPAGLSSMAFS